MSYIGLKLPDTSPADIVEVLHKAIELDAACGNTDEMAV
jgi:hypothetical protein